MLLADRPTLLKPSLASKNSMTTPMLPVMVPGRAYTLSAAQAM
jgi:hypothetical protein